jgi:hypothetical protein
MQLPAMDMPLSALFWPNMPFNALFLARKCRSVLPNVLNTLDVLDIPARELKKPNFFFPGGLMQCT